MMTERRWLSPGELADVLSSGKYPKGRSYLVRFDESDETFSKPTGYCCLGVLACEAGYKPDELRGLQFLLPTEGTNALHDGPSWLGEPSVDDLWTGNLQEHLAELNDGVTGWDPVVAELRLIQEIITK